MASYAFYTLPFYEQYGLKPISLLLLSTSLAYACGELIVISKRSNKIFALSLGVSCQLGILGLHKYLSFFRVSILEFTHFLGIEAHLPIVELIFPIGVSFYCFQAVSYLVDLYRGTGKHAQNIIDFALFQAFFPKLLIGPICKSNDLLSQIENLPLKPQQTHRAIVFIFSGLFKKAVLATILFEQGVHDAFLDPEGYSTSALWASAFAYSVQIYCDFSGYTDLAIGLALLLGFSLPNNFSAPYSARNLGIFWKRWHITFGRWLRDYIYIPLGGSRVASWRISLNLFLTFLFCGLWHGASWGYLLWGGMHGIGLALHKRNRDRMRSKGLDPEIYHSIIQSFLGWSYTFIFVSLSRIFFQVPDLERTYLYFSRLFIPSSGLGINDTFVWIIILVLGLNFLGKDIFELSCTVFLRISQLPRMVSFIIHIAFIIIGLQILFSLMPGGVPPYLYYRF